MDPRIFLNPVLGVKIVLQVVYFYMNVFLYFFNMLIMLDFQLLTIFQQTLIGEIMLQLY